MDPTFAIDIVHRDDEVVLVVVGEIDIATAPLLDERLTEAEARDAARVIVDLDRVTFMDSTGLQVLVAHALSKSNGERILLTQGSSQVQRLFTISGMAEHLPFVQPE